MEKTTVGVGEVDVDATLERKGCTDEFEKLQLCLADNNRDWVKCKDLVKHWKECFNQEPKKKV